MSYSFVLCFKKRQVVGRIDVDSKMSKQFARGKMHVRVTSRDGQSMIGVLRPRLLRNGNTFNNLYTKFINDKS